MQDFYWADGGATLLNIKMWSKYFDQGWMLYGIRLKTDLSTLDVGVMTDPECLFSDH